MFFIGSWKLFTSWIHHNAPLQAVHYGFTKKKLEVAMGTGETGFKKGLKQFWNIFQKLKLLLWSELCWRGINFLMKPTTMQCNELKRIQYGFKEKCSIYYRLKMYDGSNQNCSNMLQCSNLLNYFHTGTVPNAHPPSLASLSNLKESALNRRGVCKKEGDLEPLMCFPLWCLWLYNKGMHHRGYKKHCMTLRDVMSHQKGGGRRRLKGFFIQ